MRDREKVKVDMSVIVTVFNIEDYIGECIESILEEKRLNIEVILVNDASTDRSLSVCREYQRKDDRIVIIDNTRNLGITSSRNEGLRAAVGEFIYIMDGDDILKKNALQRMYEICRENDLDMLEFSADVFYETDDMRQYAKANEYMRKNLLHIVKDGPTMLADLQYQKEGRWGSACLHCYCGELLRKKNLFYVEGLRYADGSVFHLYLEAERVMCVPDIFYSRRVRKNSQITVSPKFYYLESLIILFVEELKRWDQYCFSDYINRGIEKYFRRTNRQIIDMYQQFKGNEAAEYMLLDKHASARYYFEHVIKRVPVCLDVFSDENIMDLENAHRIFVYGAGFYATQASEVLDYFQMEYEYVVSEKGENPGMVNGRKVYGISETDFGGNDIVIIAVSEKHQKEIVECIEQKRCKKWIQFTV